MDVVRIHHPYSVKQIKPEPVVLTLGFFDGVHRGHQAVIGRAREEASKRHLRLAVMTFNQHPSLVFRQLDRRSATYLTTIPEKIDRMAELGVDLLYIVDFTSAFANLAPEKFVKQYIVDLHAQVAVAGFDYTFGPQRAGMAELPQFAKGRFDVIQVGQLNQNAEKVSSTRIRQAIDVGDIDEAASLLGYPYHLLGTVVHGEARGRTIGFPTVNIRPEPYSRVPGIGIYAVQIKICDVWYLGMASIGRNITFGDDRDVTIEIYILNFGKMVYGEPVEIVWYSRLRGEVKFDSAAGLIDQLKLDEVATRDYFAQYRGELLS
ncbi:riboflavin biosynthesis protein RibF [Loigolactobacillus backii]|uniref:riboflavin biosynthesis protein RibF n=1 Tax=Loigolactobacillus backii TaxID=375175 RepID=UPI000C1C8744|nr:riboflavin biosynthesis protein RibF [Loigolactobacillus backii]PIO83580.1 riboflavin biosynthesis protein RibF [Loigolactobacillus backii]